MPLEVQTDCAAVRVAALLGLPLGFAQQPRADTKAPLKKCAAKRNQRKATRRSCEDQFTLRGISMYYLGGIELRAVYLKDAYKNAWPFRWAVQSPPLGSEVSRQLHDPALQGYPNGLRSPAST